MAIEINLKKGESVYTVENGQIVEWQIVRVNKMSVRCKNEKGEFKTLHDDTFCNDKKEATLRINGIESTYIVSFHYADRLTNVITGDTEEYDLERRCNLLCRTNYIVKIEDKKNCDIEYDIYVVNYNRFEPEPSVTLHDYLFYKYRIYKSYQIKSLYENVLFQCPDTAETYTVKQIIKMYRDEIKKLCEAI